MRRLMSRVVLAITALVAALAAAEAGVRVVGPVGSELQPAFAMDDAAGWSWAPSQRGAFQRNYGAPELFKTRFRTNSLGMRDRDYPLDKGDRLRILAIGDSYTEGWGVEEDQAFAKVLEREFLRDVEVWNLGVVGYSTDQEYQLLRRYIDSTRPDLVLLQFYENDIADNLRPKSLWYPRYQKPRFELRHDTLIWTNPRALRNQRIDAELTAHLRRQLVLGPLEHSALYRWARFTYRKITYRPALRAGVDLMKDVWRKNNSYRIAQTPEMRTAWELTERLLAELQRQCAERGIRLVIVYVPRGIETVPGILQGEIQKVGTGDAPEAFDLALPERRLGEVARRHGIELVRLRDVFRTAPDPQALYLPILKDGHLTPRGQALVARTVAETLRRDSLLPADRFRVEAFTEGAR